MKQKIHAAVRSDKGRVRGNNEDNFFLNGVFMPLKEMDEGALHACESDERRQIYAVCDGMGGEALGELASYTVVEGFSKLLKTIKGFGSVRARINRAVSDANAAVCALKKGAGCTLALMCLYKGKATVAWLGDSRIYLFRKGELSRLSEDQTQSQRLINLGVLEEGAAELHGMHHVLTHYVGMEMADIIVQPAYGEEIVLKEADVFLLCSDGLTDMLDEATVAGLLNGTPSECVNKLIDAALAAGGRDNVTAMVISVAGCGRKLFG